MAPDDQLEALADQLEALAHARFTDPPLTAAEIKLVRAAPKGEFAVCGPNMDNDDPQNDPSKADTDWNEDRHIRAALIRWLCVDAQAKELVDPKGVQIYGAKITDELDVTFVAVPFPLGLFRSRLMADANFLCTRIPALNLGGTWTRFIRADQIHVSGSVFLRNGFHAEGEIRFLGAEIGGDLSCVGGKFLNPAQSGVRDSGRALCADAIRVNGSVLLREGFHAEGEVGLIGARIGGDLDCGKGEFMNPATKEVKEDGKALHADRMRVSGSVYLNRSFRADGEVRLIGADITGRVDCSRGEFKNPTQAGVSNSGIALCADGFNVNGALLLRGVLDAKGLVSLAAASVGQLADDRSCWPTTGGLDLDGFTYGRIYSDTKDANARLDWLSRMSKFAPQPYRQLAKVMREEGDDRGARKVLHEMERLRRKNEDKTWYWRAWSWILGKTIGYGYYPGYSLIWLLAVVALGWWGFRSGYYAGSMVPTDKEAYWTFALQHEPPSHYEHFHAFFYSLENCFPLLKLGEADRWQPDPTKSYGPRFLVSPSLLRGLRWGQIIVGWILATFFVVGLTGILQKDKG